MPEPPPPPHQEPLSHKLPPSYRLPLPSRMAPSQRLSLLHRVQLCLPRLLLGLLLLLAAYAFHACTRGSQPPATNGAGEWAEDGPGRSPLSEREPSGDDNKRAAPLRSDVSPMLEAEPLAPIAWQRESRPAIDPAVLNEAIVQATDYLVKACDERGRFVYELDLESGQSLPRPYNELRHAGAIYALSMAYNRDRKESTLDAMRRAAGFLQRNCLAPVPGRPDMLAIWSDPQVNGGDDPRQAKLGGSGLGLIALAELQRLAPGSVPLDTLRQLGRFLLFMQKPDGSFYSKMNAAGERDDRWTSLYYPGEASLGLLMLYRLDPQPEWLQGAANAVGYLARPAAWQQPVLPDHWMLLALARLLPDYDRCQPPRSRAELLAHARRTCLGMIGEQTPNRGDPLLDGCFGDDGRTTPTATRVEGLLAALTFLPAEDRAARQQVERSVESGLRFLLRCQVRQGPHAGAMPMAQGPLPDSDPRSQRFNPSVRHVRIDYVQHALCALIQFEEGSGDRGQGTGA